MTEPIAEPDVTPDEPVEEPPPAPATEPVTPDEEAAEGEGEGEPVEPQEDEQPQPQALSEKDVEKRIDKLAREAKRHTERLEQIMEEDVVLLAACPLCTQVTPGFVMAGDLGESKRSSVRVFIGDREPENWQQDSHARRCETCQGLGEVLTGSKVESQKTLPCVDCGGKGWVGDRSPAPPVVTTTQPVDATTNGPTTPAPAQLSPEELAMLKSKGYMVMPMPRSA